jgi:hypothetical protein
MKIEMSNEGAMEAVSAKKSTTAKLDRNDKDALDSVLNKKINQHQLVVTTPTTLGAHSCRIEGQFKNFGEDDTTLKH